MLKFAAITPHPPIIIPTIGSPTDLGRVQKTILAMEKLAKIFEKSKIETLIIISPHGPIEYDSMTANMSSNFVGDFQNFGDYETQLNFENDLELVNDIYGECKKQEIPIRLIKEPRLDHGSLVPLYYLTKNLSQKNNKILKVVPLAYSFLDVKAHFEFGKIIYDVCNSKENKNRKIGVVASGDLSHRLTMEAPAGFSLRGAEFDEKLVQLLKNNDAEGVLNTEPALIKEAGECGYLSIVILLGVLSKTKKVFGPNFKFLSYEGPFGVGYLVGYFSL